MKRLLASTLAVVALTTACGVAEDTTAATVDGTDISMSAVASLAKTTYIADRSDRAGAGLVSSSDTSVGSSKLRTALGLLVQVHALEGQVKARKGSITAEDRQNAESQVTQTEQQAAQQGGSSSLEPAIRKLFVRYFAAETALVRMQGGAEPAAPTQAEVEQYFEAHADEFGVLTCVDGFAVLAASTPAAQAAIDRGDGIATILADAAIQAQPLSQDGKEVCVGAGQVTEKNLAALIENGPVGTWSSVSIEDPSNGTLTVFIRPNSREQATATTPAVVEQITSQLQQEAATARNSEITKSLQAALKAADVEIDPRYGTWDPKGGIVAAPTAPRPAGPPTTLLGGAGQ